MTESQAITIQKLTAEFVNTGATVHTRPAAFTVGAPQLMEVTWASTPTFSLLVLSDGTTV